MAFCEKCGAEISDDALFCAKCGNKTNQATVSDIQATSKLATTEEERIQSAEKLSEIYDYFKVKEAEYNEYDQLTREIPKYRFKVKNTITFLIGGVSLIFMCSLPLFIMKMIAIGVVGLIVCEAIYIFLWYLHRKKLVTKYDELSNRYEEITNELTDYYHDFGYCPIGIEYTNPQIVYQIADIVRQGRADNCKEAINVMFEDAHRDRMEFLAVETAASAQSASRGAKASAVFCAANFFLR